MKHAWQHNYTFLHFAFLHVGEKRTLQGKQTLAKRPFTSLFLHLWPFANVKTYVNDLFRYIIWLYNIWRVVIFWIAVLFHLRPRLCTWCTWIPAPHSSLLYIRRQAHPKYKPHCQATWICETPVFGYSYPYYNCSKAWKIIFPLLMYVELLPIDKS